MSTQNNVKNNKQVNFVKELTDPPIARALFGEVHWAWIWLILRLYLGWEWLSAGWGKLNNPAWTGNKAGAAITIHRARKPARFSGGRNGESRDATKLRPGSTLQLARIEYLCYS